MSERYLDRGPSRIGTAIAILAAATAVWLVADGAAQVLALAIELGGIVVLVVGVEARRRGFRIVGAMVSLIGLAGIGAALVLGAVSPAGITERLEFLPGTLGIAVLAWGLLPASAAGSRSRVALGVGLVVVGCLASGIMYGTTTPALLGAFAAAVVAWDAGERAIALGEQVGRGARTATVELVRGSATAAVGLSGVFLARFVADANVTDVPLAGLALLLVASLGLALALYT